MNKLFNDLFDLLRLRFKPLSHYVYPAWQPLALVLGVKVIEGGFAHLQAQWWQRVGFFLGFGMVEVLLLVFWLTIWWRFVLRRPITGSLFPIAALLTGAQMLSLLMLMTPPALFLPVMVGLAGYLIYMTISALSAALAEPKRVVVLALLIYLPSLFNLHWIAFQMWLEWGWLPSELLAVINGQTM